MISAKKSVSALKPYVNGRHTSEFYSQSAKVMKLDSNEASVAPSAHVAGRLTEFIQKSPLQWYPDIASTDLIEKLATYTSLPHAFIQTFNGSDNALETVCKTYLEMGDEVVMCMPSYDHFRVYAEVCDARLVPVWGDDPFSPKVDCLLEAVTPRTKIIYVVNPNNPTGMSYSHADIRLLLTKASHVLVVVDEAYFEFSGQTVAPLVKEFPNLVVSRSFSKAFGLAGLRMGYILTHPSNLEQINKVRVGKNVNTLAQVAATAALEDLESMQRYVTEVRHAKAWILEKLKNFNLAARDTPANFVLIQVAKPKEVCRYLESHLIFVRDRSFVPQLEGFIRLTIGHDLLMERFWKVFEKIPAEYLFSAKKTSLREAIG